MQSRIVLNTLAVIGLVALGGCKFIGSLHLSGNSHRIEAAGELAQSSYGPNTQQGRDYLRYNLNGLAIDSFNRAMASGEDPAAAYNGLGVAYARLGRTDLAYRFFRKATMSDPANPTYAHNLTSLIDSPEFTLNLLSRTPLPEAVRSEPKPEAGFAQAEPRAPPVPGRLYRDNNRQFSLITVAASQDASQSGAQSAAADPCQQRKVVRAKLRCGQVVLPKVASRNIRAPEVALSAPVAAPVAAVAAQPSAVVAAPAAGKAKSLNLSAPGRSTRQPANTQAPAPAALAAAT